TNHVRRKPAGTWADSFFACAGTCAPVFAQGSSQLARAASPAIQLPDPYSGNPAGRGWSLPALLLALVLGSCRFRDWLFLAVARAPGGRKRRRRMGGDQTHAWSALCRHRAAKGGGEAN